jgi:hypothetical protein
MAGGAAYDELGLEHRGDSAMGVPGPDTIPGAVPSTSTATLPEPNDPQLQQHYEAAVKHVYNLHNQRDIAKVAAELRQVQESMRKDYEWAYNLQRPEDQAAELARLEQKYSELYRESSPLSRKQEKINDQRASQAGVSEARQAREAVAREMVTAKIVRFTFDSAQYQAYQNTHVGTDLPDTAGSLSGKYTIKDALNVKVDGEEHHYNGRQYTGLEQGLEDATRKVQSAVPRERPPSDLKPPIKLPFGVHLKEA